MLSEIKDWIWIGLFVVLLEILGLNNLLVMVYKLREFPHGDLRGIYYLLKYFIVIVSEPFFLYFKTIKHPLLFLQ